MVVAKLLPRGYYSVDEDEMQPNYLEIICYLYPLV